MSRASEWYKSAVAESGKLMYLPNDPATPDLLTEITHLSLPSPCPDFAVAGWTGISGVPGTPQYQASQVYCTIATTLSVIQQRLRSPLTAWSATNRLVAYPRSGNTLNAYYDRASLRFFYNPDPVTKKVVFASESPDIVAHELGHGILDSLRPDLWNTASLEIFAFHEAFGDIMAVVSALEWPGVVEMILKETGGNLSLSNAVSRMAEELGIALYRETNGAKGHPNCLRNLVNDYKYVDPDHLPSTGPLVREPHSFSQVFSGAWYEALIAVQRHIASDGTSPAEALSKARDVLLRTFLEGVLHAPENHSFFNAVGMAMYAALSTVEGGAYLQDVKTVFQSRGVTGTVPKVHLNDTETIDPTTEGHKTHLDLEVPVLGRKKIIVHLPKFSGGLGINDMAGNLHCVKLARHAVEYAHRHHLVGAHDDKKMFAINEQGRFVRNYVCEGFCKNNL